MEVFILNLRINSAHISVNLIFILNNIIIEAIKNDLHPDIYQGNKVLNYNDKIW